MLAETTATFTRVVVPLPQNNGAYVTAKKNGEYLTTGYYTKQSHSKRTKNTVENVFLSVTADLENKSTES